MESLRYFVHSRSKPYLLGGDINDTSGLLSTTSANRRSPWEEWLEKDPQLLLCNDGSITRPFSYRALDATFVHSIDLEIWSVLDDTVDSDHQQIYIEVLAEYKAFSRGKKVARLRPITSWDEIIILLKALYHERVGIQGADVMEWWTKRIQISISLCTAYKKQRPVPWWNDNLTRLYRRRAHVRKSGTREEYVLAKKQFRRQFRKHKRRYYQNQLAAAAGQHNPFSAVKRLIPCLNMRERTRSHHYKDDLAIAEDLEVKF